MTIHLTPALTAILSICVSIWGVATVIANVCTKITEAQIAELQTRTPRGAALLRWARHWGLDLWPGLKAFVAVLTGIVRFVPAVLVLCGLAVCTSSCTSTGGIDGPQVVKIACEVIDGLNRWGCPLANGYIAHVQGGTVTRLEPIVADAGAPVSPVSSGSP